MKKNLLSLISLLLILGMTLPAFPGFADGEGVPDVRVATERPGKTGNPDATEIPAPAVLTGSRIAVNSTNLSDGECDAGSLDVNISSGKAEAEILISGSCDYIEANCTPTPEPSATPVILDMPGKVNSSTSLKDGVYTPDKFSWSGGSGRTSISCSKVTVRNGEAYATISFSSSSYAYVKASGSKYYADTSGGKSAFEIPVNLNTNNKIVGMTTAMSADHEIAYTIYVYIAGAKGTAQDAEVSSELRTAEITGLNYISTDATENSKLYRVHRYEDGFVVIDVEDVGKYLIAPEGAELPVGIEEEAVVIRRPILSIHAGSENALKMIDGMNMEACPVKSSGFEAFEFKNIDPETIAYAGSFDAPDYAALLLAGCDLAIMPESFAKPDEGGEAMNEELLAALMDVQDRFSMLGIPMFVDRSADEETEVEKLEWIKVYGILMDCEELAGSCYESGIAGMETGA